MGPKNTSGIIHTLWIQYTYGKTIYFLFSLNYIYKRIITIKLALCCYNFLTLNRIYQPFRNMLIQKPSAKFTVHIIKSFPDICLMIYLEYAYCTHIDECVHMIIGINTQNHAYVHPLFISFFLWQIVITRYFATCIYIIDTQTCIKNYWSQQTTCIPFG